MKALGAPLLCYMEPVAWPARDGTRARGWKNAGAPARKPWLIMGNKVQGSPRSRDGGKRNENTMAVTSQHRSSISAAGGWTAADGETDDWHFAMHHGYTMQRRDLMRACLWVETNPISIIQNEIILLNWRLDFERASVFWRNYWFRGSYNILQINIHSELLRYISDIQYCIASHNR